MYITEILPFIFITAALRYYHRMNEKLPEKILIYRDGVGDGQLETVRDYELPQVRDACKVNNNTYLYMDMDMDMYMDMCMDKRKSSTVPYLNSYVIVFVFIIVSKRIELMLDHDEQFEYVKSNIWHPIWHHFYKINFLDLVYRRGVRRGKVVDVMYVLSNCFLIFL